MRHQEFESPEELRNSIKCFWYNVRDFDASQSDFEVVPDGYAEIIFHFGDGCSIVHNGKLHALPSPFLMGLLNQPALFHAPNHLEIIGIRCFPWAVFELLGLPANSDGLSVLEHPIVKLQPVLKKLIEQGKIGDTINQVKQYFLEIQSPAADSMLYKAGAAMSRANGNIQVSQVADAAHSTIRTLERNFKQSSGHTVKDVSALMRFEQVRNRLWAHPNSSLASLAHELGYTDQSHLSREFKRYSSTTPAAFARRAKKRQRAGSDFVAFVQF